MTSSAATPATEAPARRPHPRINLLQVVRQRLWRHAPHWLVRPLERLIRQAEMNRLLAKLEGRYGADFCRGVLDDLGFTYSVDQGRGALPDPADRRVVYVSNHPLGGLDGMALIDMLSRHHGPGTRLRFVVNDLLAAVTPLADVFVPINKHGAQSRAATALLDEAFRGDDPVVVFPAGLVSRKGDDGTVADLAWHKMFVTKAAASGRDVIPLYFDAENTNLFYNFARWRRKLGLKFNLEMALLPGEVFKSRGKHATVHVGQRIPAASLAAGTQAQAQADAIRTITLALKPNDVDR